MFFKIALPLIHSYSVTTQAGILLVLLSVSYAHRTSRLVIAGCTSLFLAFKIAVPLVQLLFWIFKAIAMMGFYVHYFLVGIGYIVSAGTFVIAGIEWLGKELEKNARKGARDSEDE